MTAILLVFQADGRHEKITDVYVGLVVCRVDSHLYSPSQIPDFIQDIEGDLRVVCDALKARGDPSKRHTYCLFVDNLSSVMSVPTDPPYCLVDPTSYINSTLITVLQGCACIIVCATPPCSSVTMIPNCVLNMSRVTSSCPVGCSTMIGCTPLF